MAKTQEQTIHQNTAPPPASTEGRTLAKATTAGPLKECKTIMEALKHPEMVSRIQQAVPRHLSPDRMLRVMAMAVNRTPKLATCDLMTLLGAMLACASLGLEPNTPLGHAYLIPFEKRAKNRVTGNWETERVDVNLIIGYKGYIDLARRSGSMVAIHADVVYDGDEFSFEYGTDMHLRHRPLGERGNRPPVWAYAHAKLTDGQAFEVLPYGRVLEIRNKAQGYVQALRSKENGQNRAFESNPWVAFEHEMAAKTMIRRLAKFLPLSIEFGNAASLDALSEAGKVDLAAIAAATPSELLELGVAQIAEMDESDDEDKGPPPPKPTREGVKAELAKKAKEAAEPKADPKPPENYSAKVEADKVTPTEIDQAKPEADYVFCSESGEQDVAFNDAHDFVVHLMTLIERYPDRKAGLLSANESMIQIVLDVFDGDTSNAAVNDLRAAMAAAPEPATEELKPVPLPKNDKGVVQVTQYVRERSDEFNRCTTEEQVRMVMRREAPNLEKIGGSKNAVDLHAKRRIAAITGVVQ